MQDEDKTKEQLITELHELRRRVAESEKDQGECKRAEHAVREREHYLRSILQTTADGFWVVDTEGKVMEANEAYCRMSGYTRAELLALRIRDIDAVEEPAEIAARIRCFIEKGSEAFETRHRRKDGSVFDVEVSATYLETGGGQFVCFCRDITERKRAEEELGLYRDHLEDLVKERTATLAKVNEQLTREIEERKKAEQALQESQQMLQSVLDTIPVRVFWKNLDSNYLGCNRPFALDAGLQSPEEIIGRNDFEMGWAEQAELYRSDDRLVMETGSPKLGYEEPQTTPDGGRIWLRTNKVPLLDAEGRIKGVLGTYEDITESKRMEEMLRASETKYRIVADNTYDWEYWVSPEGRFLYTSPSCQRITGYTASEFETDPKLLSRIVHPDDLAQFEAHVEQDQTTSASCELEFRIIHRDGTTRWIGHVCQPVFDAQGSLSGPPREQPRHH